MKTILCYGDSNVRGVIPERAIDRQMLTTRYPKNKRWTGLLQKKLGEKYDIIEEGMGGRSTMFDEQFPGRPYRNGLKDLPLFFEAHYPIDLVIFLLGLNDTKIQLALTENDIAEGMRALVKLTKLSDKGIFGMHPKILIIAPMPILDVVDLPDVCDKTSIEKSKALPKLYQKIAAEENCDFLDASTIIYTSQLDGLHLDEDQHVLLADAVAHRARFACAAAPGRSRPGRPLPRRP